MSQPAFVPERREVWFTDGTSGFYALRVAQDVWPGAGAGTKAARSCAGRRKFTIHVKLRRGAHVRSMRATLNGKRVKKLLKRGRTVTTKRVYHPCTKRA